MQNPEFLLEAFLKLIEWPLEPKEDIFDCYKPSNASGTSTSGTNKSGSIFDAMEDESDMSSAQTYKPSPLARYSTSCYVNNDIKPVSSSDEKPKDPKRRKIAVALRQAIEPEDKKSSTEMWKSYLLEDVILGDNFVSYQELWLTSSVA
ncbi:unnamed protein product [Larinioides sclopetarius]|uniref:Uncharacterized protein n=1 Tax=Larinioides sclopetarius TaxID=280406 RepID=A0AAV1ZG48_9ARAC